MNHELVSFKGTREGLTITLGDGEWRETMNELAAQLSRPRAQSFFRGAHVLLETGNRAIDVLKIEELIALLSQNGMTLSSVQGEQHTQEAFEQVRAALQPPETIVEAKEETPSSPIAPATPADGTQAILIHRTVRSGQRYGYAGSVIVIGDINPGAEVVADGDIIVWGKLRGVVHAGASGNDNAMVGALSLTPTQLRIGRYIARAPDERRQWHSAAEIAHVRDGQIVVEPWYG